MIGILGIAHSFVDTDYCWSLSIPTGIDSMAVEPRSNLSFYFRIAYRNRLWQQTDIFQVQSEKVERKTINRKGIRNKARC
jgi:hypothetical protein